MRSTIRNEALSTFEALGGGFRLASIIPEPSRTVLGVIGLLGVFLKRRRR